MPPRRSPDTHGAKDDRPLDHLVRQLWAPLVSSADVRIASSPAREDGWVDVESYLVAPNQSRARLLVPAETRRLTSRALTNYRGLRPFRVNAMRMGLGVGTRLGLPVLSDRVHVQRRLTPGTDSPALPLQVLAQELGYPRLYASIGIRTGANGKATLQLIDETGTPVGFAKFGWNLTTSTFVEQETRTLKTLAGDGAVARTPTLLASGSWHGRPYLVSSPLPLTSKGPRAGSATLSVAELVDLCPLDRVGRLDTTAHVQALRERCERLGSESPSASLAEKALFLLRQITRSDEAVPVARWWHGDLTPWNTARDEEDVLWCWDWESSELDAMAGLDAMHWHWSVRREQGDPSSGKLLLDTLAACEPILRGLAVPRGSWPILAVLYAVTVVERACTLAAENGGWERVWIQPAELAEVMATATALVSPSRAGGQATAPDSC